MKQEIVTSLVMFPRREQEIEISVILIPMNEGLRLRSEVEEKYNTSAKALPILSSIH
jgi:hypothetical protein